MQCAKFEQRLQHLLDERKIAEQDESLREHARTCDSCDSVLRVQSQLLSELSVIPESSLPDDFSNRVLDQVRVDRRQRKRKQLLIAVLSAAAIVMIALLPLAGERFQKHHDLGSGQLAIATPKTGDASNGGLTEQESLELRILMRQLMSQLSSSRLEMLEPVDQLSSGIRPLAITLNFALDALRRTIPGFSQRQPDDPQAIINVMQSPIG